MGDVNFLRMIQTCPLFAGAWWCRPATQPLAGQGDFMALPENMAPQNHEVYTSISRKKSHHFMGYPPFSDFQTHPLLRTKKNGETRNMIYKFRHGPWAFHTYAQLLKGLIDPNPIGFWTLSKDHMGARSVGKAWKVAILNARTHRNQWHQWLPCGVARTWALG